jgi:HlyD family secretion protein
MKKKILPIILLVVAVAVISYFIYDYTKDKIGKQQDLIEASGIIEAETVTLSAPANSKLIEAGYEEGDSIEAGQTAARMDDSLIDKQIQVARTNVEAARTRLEAVKLQYKQGMEIAEKAVEQSKILKDYMSTYHHFIYYDEPVSITKSESSSSFTSSNDLTPQQLLASDIQSSSTSDSVNYAGQSQKQAVLVQLQEAINQYNMALLNLEQVKENDTQVKIAEDNLSIAESQLMLYEQQIAELDIISPIDGVILNKLSVEGEYLLPGTPIYEIGDLHNVICNIYIPEDKYGKIFLGQEVILTVDSYPDLEFKGIVNKISDKAEFTPKNIQTKQERVTTVYKITISLKNPDLQLKPGMPADVVINI